MTIEARIPLNDLKNYCRAYRDWYNITGYMQEVYNYKKKNAAGTLLSLVLFFASLVFAAVFIILDIAAETAGLLAIPAFVFIGYAVGALFYFQEDPRKKSFKKRLRLRPLYFITCLIKDFKDFKKFKAIYKMKKSAVGLIVSFRNDEAYEKIADVACEVCTDKLLYIYAYEQQYKNYREYVSLLDKWYIAGEVLEILNSGRAVDFQSAMKVIDTRRYRDELKRQREEHLRKRTEAMQKAADAARERDKAEAEANNAAAAAEKEREEFYKQLRNSL